MPSFSAHPAGGPTTGSERGKLPRHLRAQAIWHDQRRLQRVRQILAHDAAAVRRRSARAQRSEPGLGPNPGSARH